MTPERLKKVEEIYHEAIDVPPPKRQQFLVDSCGEDVDLRREIESLLSFEKAYDSLIDSSPESLINEIFSDKPNPKLIGKQVNQYKILSLLGEGGMGAVYLALDTKLERKVAIKFLSEKLISDGIGPSRFFLEAKSASALNHPNIITVHEISEFQNTPFIATEFIDGRTLKQYLVDEKLNLSEIIDIAIQIASALSVAHKAGIIHRDIKPDNVMIRHDGILKILDFGLVKFSQNPLEIDKEANTRQQVSTIHGAVMGTPKYMSPEQARGKKVDTRTDIWSFGVVLYQMLTQHLPFNGETTSDTIAAILKSEPPRLSSFVPDISPELEEITLKTLEKDQKDRYQTIDRLLEDLKSFRRELEFGTKTEPLNFRTEEPIYGRKQTDAGIARETAQNTAHSSYSSINSFVSQTVTSAKSHPSVFLLIIAVIGALSAVGMWGWSRMNQSVLQADAFQKMQLTKLTFDGNVTNEVAVSPDGKYFVYVLQEEEKQTFMLRQVATSSTVQLVPPAKVQYGGFTFTRNGNTIYYSVYQDDSSSLHEIPVLGGIPRKIASNVWGKVTFSPDGTMMAFVRSHSSLVLADVKGGSQRTLATAAEGEFWNRAEWSPDGKTILTTFELVADSREYITEITVGDGTRKPFSQSNWLIINGLAWMSDRSGIVVAGRDPETKFSQLWFVSYPDGKPQRITNDFSTYVGLSLTPDNKSLTTIKQESLYNIWVYSEGKQDSLKKITVEEGRDEGIAGISLATNGKVVYTVRTKEAFDLWSVNGDGSENRQLTFEEGSNYSPAISPDGKYIVFTSTRSGNSDLWRINIDGSDPVALTPTPDSEDLANFTPDGKWIVFTRANAKNWTTTWKLNLETQEIVQLTEAESFKPKVSPDGKVFVCYYGEAIPGESEKLAIIPIEGGKPIKLLDLPLVAKSRFRWSSDGKSLIYVHKRDRIDNLWSQTLDSNPPKQLTFFDAGKILNFSLSPDGNGIAFSRGSESSDVVLFENFR